MSPEPQPSNTVDERVWHYVLDDTPYGPTTASDLNDMARRGLIDAASLVWRDGWDEWQPLGEVRELAGVVAAATPPPIVGAPGRTESPPPSVPATRDTLRLFLSRAAAAFIDQLILLVPSCALMFPVIIVFVLRGMTTDQLQNLSMTDHRYWMLIAVQWIVHWAYSSITESSALMGTIGKRALGLRVTDLHGRRLGFGRASARYWSKLLSSPLVFGYLFALLTGGKRALHDMVAGTVIDRAR